MAKGENQGLHQSDPMQQQSIKAEQSDPRQQQVQQKKNSKKNSRIHYGTNPV